MRVKRYLVDSMPDALQKIRSELGNDAIIVSTKDVKQGGFLGMFGKKKIEVVAAIDTAAANKAPVQPAPRPVPTIPLDLIKPFMGGSTLGGSTSTDETRPQDTNIFQIKPEVKVQTQAERSRVPETKSTLNEDAILAEMKSMREMIQKLSTASMGSSDSQSLPDMLLKYEARFIDQEVSQEIIKQLIDRCLEELSVDGDFSEEAVRKSLRTQLMSYFPSEQYRSISENTRIVHFVGPTGVGKTTTIAKLAAEQVLKYRHRVGFITSDTYRIAAVEQLNTYANILNIPTEVVFSPKDLSRAFDQLREVDIIFMDTAGRNYRNEMYVSELHTLLQSEGQSETYLVLSMTTKYRDMKAITANFQKFNLDKVILTKFDETDSYGCILNLVHDFGLTFSYIANGQNVPDDIELFKAERIIDLIMGDSFNE
ncbi:flagellar biosynthesis protein FlhF [Paenibacillus albiflavus]|uniref:Flagellar biosynthesis protein FlhF n=1 Tax=Paenibacillus albiflavus TaxID=2545760 RepID=A0A4R4ENP2_9BACL|nr:flagellar biosynthesis protein FlhF [Paenibacillus albiflavus]TCZ79978.1 flagellar biosynthesis protein FlhF [Paenibacillus albiflavus]